jgi:RNA polymerase sigma-70 factor (ECF subfamily)
MMLSDDKLVRRIVLHDDAAFEVFYARHRDRIHRHLLRMMRDADIAEDLTQEAFLRVWTRAEQWDGRGACLSWLLRIATNLAYNQLRTLQRRRELPLEGTPDDEEQPAPGWMIDAASLGPEAMYEQAERRDLIRRLVDNLPEEKRQVIHLVHEAEMEIHDVADTLGIPEGTVKSRLHYARKHLAREWKDYEEEQS